MEFSRQEHWSGLPFPALEDLPDPGIKPMLIARRNINNLRYADDTTLMAEIEELKNLLMKDRKSVV